MDGGSKSKKKGNLVADDAMGGVEDECRFGRTEPPPEIVDGEGGV